MSRRQAATAAVVAVAAFVIALAAGGLWARNGEPAARTEAAGHHASTSPTQPSESSTAPAAPTTTPASAPPATGPARAPANTPSAATATTSPQAGAGGEQARRNSAPEGVLAQRYARDLGQLATRSGIAIVPLGGGPAVVVGEQTSGVAWSTIKVPIAVAARQQQGWESRARAAITVSDNNAALALWASLGAGAAAADRVQAVLAAAGDPDTKVQPTVVRAPFTPFGQTQWTVPAQAQAMSGLACQPAAQETVGLMRQVVSGQRWGLGRWQKAPIKGGWGPLESGGGYLVRQMGVIPVNGGEAAVAMLVRAPGGFEAGVADLNRMAVWLADQTKELPAGRC
ncbi:hypothetical protein BJY21_003124 [Kineosphaera limosa]|uniref:Beta-lactamase class A catalytic domain-containing protein n=1 Tax=Kineosphaera limosa NBRC 100340 TaxID=1184609 RepID=K6WVN9_9MICO|nr:serine hydrolase [Kineosphaera limosa]NYE01940.1 hypothetical protein [Kineosphaera limosa]GAB96167.1 hypothetical protein KILIM_032_00530 [Kineosphaera limosa NBRC 100340]